MMDKEIENMIPNIDVSGSRITQYNKNTDIYSHTKEMIACSMKHTHETLYISSNY